MFSHPQWQILTTNKARTLFHSGKGGGKTHVMGAMSALFVQHIPQALGLIAANTYGQLTDSTLLEIFTYWKEQCGWTEWTKYNESGNYVIDKQPPQHFKPHGYTFKSNQNKVFFQNGCVIMLASLDNWKAIDGRTISWALLDETKDTPEAAVKEVIISRLRKIGLCRVRDDVSFEKAPFRFCHESNAYAGDPVNPLMIFTAPSKEQWLTEYFHLQDHEEEIESSIYAPDNYFVKDVENRRIVIASTFHNAANLPPNYISDLESDLSSDQQKFQIYGSPFGKAGNEYYVDYSSAKHVRACQVVDGYPIHLSFDFNVNPYMTGLVIQVIPPGADGRGKVRAVMEYALANPRNTIEDVCEDFDYDYGHIALKYGFYFYGDATGKAKQPIREMRDHYSRIENKLRHIVANGSRRLLKQNPRNRAIGSNTLGRRDFLNKCLRGAYGFDLEIDASCKNLILDLQHIKEDANGAKHKQKITENKITYEKYGHLSDALDAFLAYVYGSWAKEK